ncbi:MAG: hypothetical protein QY323_05285 [Patescibacteria group bacterium]|nr:MAG: hypothetical protein QY323_05285 [Patescibacteria group bacterium]
MQEAAAAKGERLTVFTACFCTGIESGGGDACQALAYWMEAAGSTALDAGVAKSEPPNVVIGNAPRTTVRGSVIAADDERMPCKGAVAAETNSPPAPCMHGTTKNEAMNRKRKDPKTSFAVVRINSVEVPRVMSPQYTRPSCRKLLSAQE